MNLPPWGGAKKFVLNSIYPIGIVIGFVNSTDPNVIFAPQVWEKLPGGYHPLTTNNNNPNMSSTDASNHKPGEAIAGGLPEIAGWFDLGDNQGQGNGGGLGGAFHAGGGKGYYSQGRGGSAHAIDFNASNYCTIYGTYQSNKNCVIGDHIAMVMWKRTN